MRGAVTRRTPWIVALAAAAVVLAYQLAVDHLPGAATASDVVLVLVAFSAAVAAARTLRVAPAAQRRFWTFGTVGFAAWACGQTAWSIERHVAGGIPNGLSPAYLGFGVAALAMPAMLLSWPSSATRDARLRIALDGLAIAAALAFLVWRPLLAPLLESASGGAAAGAGALAVPMWDLCSLAGCVLVLTRGEGAARRVIGPLAAGNALIVGGGLLVAVWQGIGSERAANGADGAIFVGTFLFIAAARGGRRFLDADAARDDLGGGLTATWVQSVPLLPVAAALVTGVVQQITVGPPEGGQMWAGFLLVSAVVVRQLLAVRDATQLAERVHAQAWQDPLTGLANRAQLGQRLRRAVERAPAEGGQVGVLLLDLDGFKAVNDGQGHQVGDELLRVVADRLRACLRPQDVAARLGGDEFVVLVEDLPAPAVEALAVRLLAALRAPVALGATTVRVAGSLGIVVGDGRSSADELLADADLAMYAAKRAGRGRYSWYAPGQRAELEARVRLEDDLKQAVDAGEFVAHFQPLVDLGRGRVTGAEALVRWAHPSRGLLAPGAFLPAAEELGLMPEIGRRVLAQALHAAAGWPHAAGEPMTISVNLSASQLADPALRAFLVETLAASGCPPEAVLLELTETLVLDDLDGAAASMAALKELGVRIALDDFGTGYSALSALRALPVDVLKIDKAFIDELGTGADSGLSAAMIGLAASLALTPIAEGIESAAQVSALTELACPLGQGFFYARALPDDEFRALLDAPLAPAGRPAPVARAA